MAVLIDFFILIRPFTLFAPFVGFLAGAVIAAKGFPPWISFVGALASIILNAASNVTNQICDVDIDKINKPGRPLPGGKITAKSAIVFAVFLYIVSLALALVVSIQFFIIVVITALMTLSYSCPPFRLKKWMIISNMIIAIPRGVLLIAAGWSSVKSVCYPEPWFIGSIFGLYILGAASTKDFSDIKGDKKYGIKTLQVVFGVKKAARFICPFLVFPFLLIPVGVYFELIKVYTLPLTLLALWGGYICYLIVRKPEELSYETNHISWKHMYVLLLCGQIGFIVAYLI
jgi:4-hydroxybenzoate polyprenyltransferase